jgi:hypothetical protein
MEYWWINPKFHRCKISEKTTSAAGFWPIASKGGIQ